MLKLSPLAFLQAQPKRMHIRHTHTHTCTCNLPAAAAAVVVVALAAVVAVVVAAAAAADCLGGASVSPCSCFWVSWLMFLCLLLCLYVSPFAYLNNKEVVVLRIEGVAVKA